MEENRIQQAEVNYNKGYNCSQAVFCACADLMGLDESTAFRMAEGFGGGIGGLRSTCGAVSAMIGVVSYLNSDGLLDQGKTKVDTYRKIRAALAQFQKEYGSVICKEILQGESSKAKMCGEKVKDAVKIIETMQEEQVK